MQSKRKISAVIPFYNEINTLNKVIEQTRKYVDFIIAVNDGSTDGSEFSFEQNENIFLLNHEKNLGKGAALRTGFSKAIELDSNFTLTIDADLQHEPSKIMDFIRKCDFFDVLIGNRLHDLEEMPIQRRMSNKITSWMLSKKLSSEIIDSQSGFRMFNSKILNQILPESNGFEAETEMIIKAGKRNLKIGFVDIPTIYGQTDSKMKSLEAIWGFLHVYFKY